MLIRIIVCFLMLSSTSHAQIEGFVKDAAGNGIPYATLIWLKQKAGTLSDSTGRFNLQASSYNNDSLEISAMGSKHNTEPKNNSGSSVALFFFLMKICSTPWL
jgi:hypothetical protein